MVVHPDFRQSAVGEALLEWGETHARLAVGKAPDGAEVALRASCDQKVAYSKMLYKNHGMVLDRHLFRMEIEFEEAPAPPVIPEGMIIRQFAPESELEMLARTYLDSFRDHYGFAEVPLAKQVENIQFMIDNDPHYDPDLWFLVMDGEEAAGFSLCFFQTTEDLEMGWVGCWGAPSLVARARICFAAAFLSGALHAWEQAGRSVTRRRDTYKKILRPGEEITTTSL